MANFNFNKVIIGGRLTADPELKTTPSGISVVSFTVAVIRLHTPKEESITDFLSVTVWRQTAEFVAKCFRKGYSICVTGSLQTRSWTTQNGEKKYGIDVVADEVCFVDSKSEMPAVPVYGDAEPAPAEPKFEVVADDEDLPF